MPKGVYVRKKHWTQTPRGRRIMAENARKKSKKSKKSKAETVIERASKMAATADNGKVRSKITVRVISHQDGITVDKFPVRSLGELWDILHNNYVGIKITEALISWS